MTTEHHAHPIMLYDGVCNLCNGTVRFILRRDREGMFRFAAMQSRVAEEILAGFDKKWEGDTFYLVLEGKLYDRSSAMLRIMKRLRFPWPLMSVFLLVPKPLRDMVYNCVARNRYRWFGRTDACQIPDKDILNRFLDLTPFAEVGPEK